MRRQEYRQGQAGNDPTANCYVIEITDTGVFSHFLLDGRFTGTVDDLFGTGLVPGMTIHVDGPIILPA